MPDLEAQIAAWRARLAAAMPGQEETLNELESHLRDHIEVQMRRGVSAEAAFAQGIARLGEPRTLAREFARTDGERKWAAPVVIIYAVMGLAVAGLTLMLASGARGNGRIDPLLGIHVFLITTGYLAMLTAGLIGLWTLMSGWQRPSTACELRIQRRELWRMTTLASVLVPVGMALGAFWARDHRPAGAWAWEPVEIGALSVLLSAWLLFAVQRWTGANEIFRAVLALLGAAVVGLGWFGAKALTAPVPIAWLCGATIFAQGAIALLHERSQRRRDHATRLARD